MMAMQMRSTSEVSQGDESYAKIMASRMTVFRNGGYGYHEDVERSMSYMSDKNNIKPSRKPRFKKSAAQRAQ